MPTGFPSYSIDPNSHLGQGSAFGGMPGVSQQQPTKVMYKTNVLPLDAFGSQVIFISNH